MPVDGSHPDYGKVGSLPPDQFVNPIGEGADPWVIRDPNHERYLWCFSDGNRGIAISLVGAIVGELPTGAVEGLGARLLAGSYYGQTVQIWSALITAASLAAVLVALVGIANTMVLKRMGMAR